MKRAPTDGDFALPLLLDRSEIALDVAQHVRNVRRGGDRSNGSDPVTADHACRREHCGAAKAVADQQDLAAEPLAQMMRRGDQVFDIAGKARAPEIAAAAAQPGEVEPQRCYTMPRQRARHLDRRLALLRAGETVRKQRCPAHQPRR